MKDYYLEDITRLKGQPKRTISDYAEENGILVPKRFNSLNEARKSGKEIFMRSEHSQEYAGMSGLLSSFSLDLGIIVPAGIKTMKKLVEEYFNSLEEKYGKNGIHQSYSEYFNLDIEKFKEEVSFSIWEKLGGTNRLVVADSAIPNRYHVTAERRGKTLRDSLLSYTIFENGKIEKEFEGLGLSKLSPEMREDLHNLINTYERVRNLKNFDPNHGPMMEFQTVENKNYFLQYHRGRNFEEADFVLDRKKEKGEIEVPFVRGKTSPEGMDCKVTAYYFYGKGYSDWKIEGEDGSWDTHYNHIFSEDQVRKRKIQMINPEKKSHLLELGSVCERHSSRSKLFKPQVSIIQNLEDLFVPGETLEKFYEQTKKGHNSFMNLHVVADGRKAYVKRI